MVREKAMKVEIGEYPEDGGDREFSVEISDSDIFSADVTLAIVILPLLKKLKEEKNGAPDVRNEDVPEELRAPVGIQPWDDDPNWQARWDYVIDKMIWSFEQLHPDSDDWQEQFYTGEADFKFIPSDEKDEFGEHYHKLEYGPNHTLVFDEKGYQEYEDRIDEGLRLFGVYFRGLWT